PVDSAPQAALLATLLDTPPPRAFPDSLAPPRPKRPTTQARPSRLNPPAPDFLDSLAPPGAKRPITKARLSRLIPAALLDQPTIITIREIAANNLYHLDPTHPTPATAIN